MNERITEYGYLYRRFQNGMCIEFNGKLCTIVEFQHVKPGKGSAFVRTKLRDIRPAASSTTR